MGYNEDRYGCLRIVEHTTLLHIHMYMYIYIYIFVDIFWDIFDGYFLGYRTNTMIFGFVRGMNP